MNLSFTLRSSVFLLVAVLSGDSTMAQPLSASVAYLIRTAGDGAAAPGHAINTAKTTATGSRITAYSNYRYNTTAAAFLPLDSTAYSYASPGNANNTQKTEFTYAGTAWKPAFQYANTYNASGHLTSAIQQAWNAATSTYTNNSKYAYINNSAGYATDVVVSNWISGAWVNNRHTVTAYNAANYPTTIKYQNWNTSSGTWIDDFRYVYTRNTAGRATSILGETWDAASATWIKQSKEDSTYNATGVQLILLEWFTWNTSTLTWGSNGRHLYTLDGSGRPATFINQSYAPPTNTYSNELRGTYTYDAAGNNTILLLENWDILTNTWSTEPVKATNTYNSYNQRTSYMTSVFKNNVWTHDNYNWFERYTYQTYTISGGGTAGIPIPATDIQITLALIPPATY